MTHGFPVIVFEPEEELVFRDKLGHVTGVQLIIRNKNLEEIYFKVKSTASKFYSVRPSSGTIKPHGQVKVIIQPHDDSAKSLDVIEENNHRFMIQSAFVDNKSPKTADEFWQSFDKGKVPVTTCKLHVRVKRLDSNVISSTEATNGGTSHSQHRQGLEDQAEAFAKAHFHVQNTRAKEHVKDVEAVVRKEDHEKKTINGNVSSIPSIPLVRDIVENIGLVANTVEEVQNGVKGDDMKDGKIDEASELEKVIGKDNKEEGNMIKNKFKNLNGAANAVANAEVMAENEEEIQKSSNLNVGPSNGDCTEEMRVQMESPLPNNQPSHFTIANTSNETKIDNLSSTMFKQQKPLFNSSQFCYYPMPFVEPAFHSGAESGNGYYGRYIASVLDKMPKKIAITMKREIAELIAKFEQKVAEEENE
ncbi:unnamed protein product [Meloidogyne enterolobii]|uniref:Uncharacterized protein n=2 Tax=Meloidogyne enterolobii TaxID=390850 RepID=A0ACB0XKU7_MELEN